MRAATPELTTPAQRALAPAVGTVLLAFVASRLALFAVGWLSRVFPSSVPGERGWTYFSQRGLDVWAQWDTDWYVGIALSGYAFDPAAAGQQNVVFFPSYPMLIRGALAVLPAHLQTPAAAALAGIVLANLFALGALVLLLLYARDRLGDDASAERAVVYLLAFPSAFFLSAAYTESLFLFLAIGTFLCARRGRWALAGLAGLLLGLTRPNGVAMMLPLAWIYLEQRGWRLSAIRADLLFLAAPAAGFAAYAAYLGAATGDPLAMIHAQGGWGRALATPWHTLFVGPGHALVDLDRIAALAFLAAALAMIASPRWRVDGLIVLVVVSSFLFSGRLLSASRLVLPAFPAFVALAYVARSPRAERALLLGGAALQGALLLAWGTRFWLA